ncbi:MAG TPA: permease-like cell division protein FtsX [Actinomycetota bacterium]|nr:permease-like cell division protein FtsX [Actinomycetota bacterium]
MRRIGYFISETIQNLRRNFLMTIAAISTVAISLLLLGGVQILGMIVNNVTLDWEAKVEVSAYLLDDASPGEIHALEEDLSKMPEVEHVFYVSKEQAFEEFKRIYRDQPEFWETLPPDALPASLRIKLTDANFAQLVSSRIEGAPGVDEVKNGGEFIRRLLQVNSLLRTITFAMSLILMGAAAALIANTIRVAIYARRDEIGIMKLVGATNWFIRIPFMLEGVFAALVGALISGGIVLLTNALLFSRIGETLHFLSRPLNFTPGEIGGVLLVLIVVGSAVGLIGSGLALRRFLDV